MMQSNNHQRTLTRHLWRRRLRQAILLTMVVAGCGTLRATALQIAGLQGATAAEQGTEVLQKRVREFYTLLQMRQTSRAEQYATTDSRERLRDQVNNPFMGFRVVSVSLNPDHQSGTAVVELMVMAPFATAPVPIRRTSEWKVEDGEWRVEVPAPPENTGDLLALTAQKAPKPEELKFVGHKFGLGVMKPGEVKEARYPFENVTDHVVKIAEVATGCECLKNKTTKLEYQPGEKGEIVIAFDSTNYEYAFLNTIVVTTNPGDVKSYLQIGAQVVPRAIAFPDKQPEAAQN